MVGSKKDWQQQKEGVNSSGRVANFRFYWFCGYDTLLFYRTSNSNWKLRFHCRKMVELAGSLSLIGMISYSQYR